VRLDALATRESVRASAALLEAFSKMPNPILVGQRRVNNLQHRRKRVGKMTRSRQMDGGLTTCTAGSFLKIVFQFGDL